ncbi:taurine catabolism dioxygenase [Thioalkalivibrio nitratireducens DSM 14787]|uniref:Taurine catabolism dioxygenase n=1 Tax=Thioalkalivibrio nitratireducens (strain DSM 14787 / UNIQEM 213 / ALEN2) TaxID=1255043 RepID=L0DWK7_THIND|nr:TauD/TfdA family dioxygenase [Thioalkalivibrio nitratireducens]AGA33382.1 taurine catabolism dioxygenase [Thioalkalivibrio nitratireducens DSM 14787]
MRPNPFDLDDHDAYQAWREHKLASAPTRIEDLLVEVEDPRALSPAEHEALLGRCRQSNMAVYASRLEETEGTEIPRRCGEQFGLFNLDHNRGAGADAVTSLTVQSDALHARYIPYTDRAIHWHTDGYYNRLDLQDHGLLLHCVRPARHGGENALMDHEMAYLLMRDTNPDHVRALMQEDAMQIPRNVVDGVELRPDRSGPVFMVTAEGRLHMRYTMRKRNVVWKDDPAVRAAVAWLEELLTGDSPYIFRATLQPGWGLVSNNVLHDRSAFDDDPDPARKRLLYRARYHDRIRGT